MVLQDAVQLQEMACSWTASSLSWMAPADGERGGGANDGGALACAHGDASTGCNGVSTGEEAGAGEVRHRDDCQGGEALESSVVPRAMGGLSSLMGGVAHQRSTGRPSGDVGAIDDGAGDAGAGELADGAYVAAPARRRRAGRHQRNKRRRRWSDAEKKDAKL